MESKKKLILTKRPDNENDIKRKILEFYSKHASFFFAPIYSKEIFKKFLALEENKFLKDLNEAASNTLLPTNSNSITNSSIFESLKSGLKRNVEQYNTAIHSLCIEGDIELLNKFLDKNKPFAKFIYNNIAILQAFADKFERENPDILNNIMEFKTQSIKTKEDKQKIQENIKLNNEYLTDISGSFSEEVKELRDSYDEENGTYTSNEAIEDLCDFETFNIEGSLSAKHYELENNRFMELIDQIITTKISLLHQNTLGDKPVIKKSKLETGTKTTKEEEDDELRRKSPSKK